MRSPGAGWRSVNACSRAVSTSSVGICAVRCQPNTRREQVSRQVAPAPADQRQVRDVTDPHLIGTRGGRLSQQPVFGYDRRRVGLRGARALGAGAERALPAGPQPTAQRVALNLVASARNSARRRRVP